MKKMRTYVICKTQAPCQWSRSQPGVKGPFKGPSGVRGGGAHLLHTVTFLVLMLLTDNNRICLIFRMKFSSLASVTKDDKS